MRLSPFRGRGVQDGRRERGEASGDATRHMSWSGPEVQAQCAHCHIPGTFTGLGPGLGSQQIWAGEAMGSFLPGGSVKTRVLPTHLGFWDLDFRITESDLKILPDHPHRPSHSLGQEPSLSTMRPPTGLASLSPTTPGTLRAETQSVPPSLASSCVDKPS